MFMKQEIYENHVEVMIIFLLQEEQSHTCKKRHMPNCRVRNRLNVLHKGGDFIEKTVKIEKISIVTCFMFMPEIGPKW